MINGASVAATSPLGATAWARMDLSRLAMRGLLLVSCLWLALAVVVPLCTLLVKSMQDQQGGFVGLANFVHYFQTPALSNSLYNP